MSIFLETERLLIKVPKADDVDNWCAIYAEDESNVLSKEEIKKRLEKNILDYEKHGFSMGSVYLKCNNTFIGRAGLFDYVTLEQQHSHLEMGYGLLKAYWGQGYAAELAMALINWSFTHVEVDKVLAFTYEDNHRSRRVLEKVGMQYVKKVCSEGETFLLYQAVKQHL
jgi:[ribosomal protein S5]-alanine N-acetyltransferase